MNTISISVWKAVALVVFLGCTAFVLLGQPERVDPRRDDLNPMLGSLHITSSGDGKTIHLWVVRETVVSRKSDFMNGWIKSYEVQYMASVPAESEIGGAAIAWNESLERNAVKIFGSPYSVTVDRYAEARREMENFLRLK